MADLHDIVDLFHKLAQEGIDPEEVENWREQTHQGIGEELSGVRKDIARDLRGRDITFHDEQIDILVKNAELFLGQVGEFAPAIEYLLSKGVGTDLHGYPIRASQVISYIRRAGINSIIIGFLNDHKPGYGQLPINESIAELQAAVFHAQNIVRAKAQQSLGKELSPLTDSMFYWIKHFGIMHNQEDFSNVLEKHIKFVQEMAKNAIALERVLVPLSGLIEFVQSKTYALDRNKNKTLLPLKIPRGLNFEVASPKNNIGTVVESLVKVYQMLRSNAVEISNFTRSQFSMGREGPYGERHAPELEAKPIKRIKKKPKDALPFTLPQELYSYILKLFKNRDDAIAEIMRLQKFMEDTKNAAWFSYLLYSAISGKNIQDWYREYVYKDENFNTLRNFAKNWNTIEKGGIVGVMFSRDVFGGMKKLVEKNGDYQNIFKILSAVAESVKVVHNFQNNIMNNPYLKDEIEEVYLQGKGGIFKFDIVPRYIYAKSALRNLDSEKENVSKAAAMGLIDEDEFYDALGKMKNLRLVNIERTDYDDIKKAEALFKSVNNLEHILEFEEVREDKNEALFNLDDEFEFEGKKIEFKVLRDRDPLHFFIGLETDCCQTIGGAGEYAAIDSYINPNAGVVVMYVDNVIVGQSYFHYMPKATEEDIARLKQKGEEKDLKRKMYLFTPIEEIESSVRTHNILVKLGLALMGDIAHFTTRELEWEIKTKVKIRGEKRAAKEVRESLKEHGLNLGIRIDNWPANAQSLSKEEQERIAPTLVIHGAPLPEQQILDNGVILDNVEVHPSRMKANAISQKNLNEIYAKYAKTIAEKLGLNYVRCGEDYNALSENSFEDASMTRDPRTFKSKKKYSDFSKREHLDLLDYKPDARISSNYDYDDANDAYAFLHNMVRKFTRLAMIN